jgi:Domain of unknown function (DUF4148)
MRFTTPFLAVALFAGVATTAAADSAEDFNWTNVTLTKSRADVRAETLEAVRSGALPQSEAAVLAGVYAPIRSTMTRAQVRAEAIEAMRLGLIPSGERERRQATPAELAQIRQAGLRAAAAGSAFSQAGR